MLDVDGAAVDAVAWEEFLPDPDGSDVDPPGFEEPDAGVRDGDGPDGDQVVDGGLGGEVSVRLGCRALDREGAEIDEAVDDVPVDEPSGKLGCQPPRPSRTKASAPDASGALPRPERARTT